MAVTAAFLAVLAAITSLMAEHHANEAMLDQIRSSNKWSYYQAESIKANLFATKIELLQAMGKTVNEKDLAKVEQYRKDQKTVKEEAKHEERASEAQLLQKSLLLQPLPDFHPDLEPRVTLGGSVFGRGNSIDEDDPNLERAPFCAEFSFFTNL